MITSCGDDLNTGGGGGGGFITDTTMSLSAISETTVALGDTFTVNMIATTGENALNVFK